MVDVKMDKDTKTMTSLMVVVMLAGVMMGFLQKTAPPAPEYECPICGEKFYTYEELYQHFTTEHPAEPITITWE